MKDQIIRKLGKIFTSTKFLDPVTPRKWNALETAIDFSIANNIVGDYLEFGVFRGASFIHAIEFYKRRFTRYQLTNHGIASDFMTQRLRFFAFDSFEGLPPISDKDIPAHWQGMNAMKCTHEEFLKNLNNANVDLCDIKTIQGFYNTSLTKPVLEQHNLSRAAIVNIDCDLYESTVKVLDFLTPLVVDGTVLYFDDWFYYSGHPKKGERGAFNEWLSRHPNFIATELCNYYPAVSYIVNLSE